MAGKCPLAVTSSPEYSEGYAWDAGIPRECWECLIAALKNSNSATELFEPELDEGEDLNTLETYTSRGIKRRDESTERTAVQEVGIDYDGSNVGNLLLRKTVEFNCEK